MPPAIAIAGIAAAGTIAGGAMAKSAANRQADAAEKAGQAAAHQTVEEIVHKSPAEEGAMSVASMNIEAEFQKALRASLEASSEEGLFG